MHRDQCAIASDDECKRASEKKQKTTKHHAETKITRKGAASASERIRSNNVATKDASMQDEMECSSVSSSESEHKITSSISCISRKY